MSHKVALSTTLVVKIGSEIAIQWLVEGFGSSWLNYCLDMVPYKVLPPPQLMVKIGTKIKSMTSGQILGFTLINSSLD